MGPAAAARHRPGQGPSYFLFAMPPDELARCCPLAASKGRGAAASRRARPAQRRQAGVHEICFVAGRRLRRVRRARALLRRGAPPPPGNVVDESGAVVAPTTASTAHGRARRGLAWLVPVLPLYVTLIDARRAMSGRRARGAESDRLRRGDVQWLGRGAGTRPPARRVQVRHRARPLAADIEIGEDGARVALVDSSWSRAPGQAAVLTDGDAVLGAAGSVASPPAALTQDARCPARGRG